MIHNDEDIDIKITFEIEEVEIEISNTFSIEFIINDKIYKGIVKGNYLTLPVFCEKEDFVQVIFKFDDHNLHFPKVDFELISYPEQINWVFIVKYPPFTETRIKNLNVREPLKIHYLLFSPKEGTGIEIIEPVYAE
ncbi:hypothetical protein ACFOUP_12370 [Belliella kenyensis]|uniref:Flagellar assembly factor FliW n=1 Tax=Belliella kenyensis TaxID=1472724 RepID=A0ABV8ELG3_9BACT|nr:hypothetical protein [Belliella kenyensis]MCH7400768.1 hypothetical protein [Belliella kenyensis]MDN3601944.1 hypothetical protein [Belliella kenyensis]